MAVIKYNDTELDYNDIEKAVLNGWDDFLNTNSFYGTPRSNGTYKKKYEERRAGDKQALLKVLSDLRNNDDVVVTASGITWNKGLNGLIDDPAHRRAAGYISKTLMNMQGKSKPEKKKLSKDILDKELIAQIGPDVSSLNQEYRTKAYNDAISYILGKYTNLDDYDIAEGFDWDDYKSRLTGAQQALTTVDDLEDDKYWLQNRLGIPIVAEKPKVVSNYDAMTNNFIQGLTSFGLSRQEAEELYNTQVRQTLIQKYIQDFMNKNVVGATSQTTTPPSSTNKGVAASPAPKSSETPPPPPPSKEWTQESLTKAVMDEYTNTGNLSKELKQEVYKHKDDWFKSGKYQDKVFFGSDGKLHVSTKREEQKRSRYAKKGGYLKLLKNYGRE